jgi:hypothetical protein
MRKLIIFGAAVCLAGIVAGSVQATPLGGAAANANIERGLPDQGVTKAWYRGRHYGWYRGHHYGWRRHYAYWHRW